MEIKKINVGGQAVIEGVMIKSMNNYAVAVRKGKKIIIKKEEIKRKKYPFFKWYFFRGFVGLLEMLVIGMKSIIWSAEQAAPKEEKIGRHELAFTLLLSIGFAILFFIALPYFLTSLAGLNEEHRPFLFNILDGIIRIIIFLVYIILISFMEDVKTLFQYHGAEHKAIHCYERGKELNVKNVKSFTTLHPRCGTSFLLIVFIVSILVFSILPSIIVLGYPNFLNMGAWLRKGILIPLRIALLPLIAGISYEILKMSDKQKNSIALKLISMPGLSLQKITTKEPTNEQIAVAIASLKSLLELENARKNKKILSKA